MPNLFVETFEEFKARMNCDSVAIVNQSHRTGENVSHYSFENGAVSDGRNHEEPPGDPVACSAIKVDFLTRRLKQEQTLFESCRSFILAQANYARLGAGPAPEEAAFTDLERLKANVAALQLRLQDAQIAHAALRGPTPEERFAESRRERIAVASDAVARAMKCQI